MVTFLFQLHVFVPNDLVPLVSPGSPIISTQSKRARERQCKGNTVQGKRSVRGYIYYIYINTYGREGGHLIHPYPHNARERVRERMIYLKYKHLEYINTTLVTVQKKITGHKRAIGRKL